LANSGGNLTRQLLMTQNKIVEDYEKKGINVLNWHRTLGSYDTVFILEAEN